MFVMCKLLQMATMVFNNIVTCLNDGNFFFLASFTLFLLHHFFFSSYKFFSSSHTLFFLLVHFFFPITHDPISTVMDVNYFLVAHEFFLSFSPSCFSNHVIDSYLSAQNLFPSHCMTLFPQSN
jgi:hypothetical protein